MRRIKVVGLCLVAVFALAAVMASGAQAGQWGTCGKAAKEGKKYTGNYTDKLCSTKSATKEGKYEWVPNAATIPLSGESGPTHLKGEAGEIACTHATGTGTIEGATKGTATDTFFGCKLKPFELACKSYGAAEGEIVTYELATVMIDHGEKGLSGKEPAEGEVWQQNTNKGTHTDPVFGPGPWLASFECGGIPFAVTGSVSGVVEKAYVEAKLKAGKAGKKGKPGKPTLKIAFTEKGGEQDLLTTFVNPTKEDKVETGPSIQEGTLEGIISPLPKGLELDSI